LIIVQELGGGNGAKLYKEFPVLCIKVMKKGVIQNENIYN